MKNIFDVELEIIQFNVNDIITTSDLTDGSDINADKLWQ